MAKSALKRRRGQRKGSRSCFSQRGWIQAILGGCALLVFGLAAGVIFGLIAFSYTGPDGASPALRNSKVFDINHIVANNVNTNNNNNNNNESPPQKLQQQQGQQQHDISLGAYSRATITNKKQFLKHEMQFGNADGGFPYYPNDGALIEKDHDFSTFVAPGGNRFEEYMHGDSPYTISISPNNNESDELARSRRYHVKKAMQHAYHGYEKYAFGMDELTPTSKSGHNNWGGIGTTLVDSLDTLWLMDMKDEFYRARDWCKTSLDHNIHKKVSVFETTIRSLGGLLSAYDWSGDQVFLDQANDLGGRLFKAFDTESGIPRGQVNLASGQSDNIAWTGSSAILSEFGTMQIEYRVLARLNGRKDYKDKVEKVYEIMDEMNPEHGLYPYFIRNTGDKPEFANQKITFGAMSDSFYEYMLKIWIQGGKTEPLYRKMYDKSIQGMHDELLSVSTPSGLVFIADKNSGNMDYKMDHLVCFMGGLLALGAYTDPQGLQSDRAQRDLKTAKVSTFCSVLFLISSKSKRQNVKHDVPYIDSNG
ncbi:MAG: hypothetical protein ACI90V_001448 [Bacillariaceae sp.]|jgi:mannosyl-oligosaccharide alpha-1,2-mannosidase